MNHERTAAPGAMADPPVVAPKADVAAPPVSTPRARVVPPPIVIPGAAVWNVGEPAWRLERHRGPTWFGRCLAALARKGRIVPSSCVLSAVLHALLMVVLGLWIVGRETPVAEIAIDAIQLADEPPVTTVTPRPTKALDLPSEISVAGPPTPPAVDPPTRGQAQPTSPGAQPARAPISELAPAESLLDNIPGIVTDALVGRLQPARGKLLADLGGTAESEAAVERGLQWLALHQRENGSWHFDLGRGPCAGECRHSGSVGSTTAATGLALLCFLGHGETHLSGQYKDAVLRGLKYLESRALWTDQGADFQEGTMYAQGIAAIALCEACTLTRDRSLTKVAQGAVDFVLFAQDSNGGGWRYTPGQPGDTTVTGWQLMALKSAQMAYLRVPYENVDRAGRFLDKVSSEKGAYYGYLDSGKEPTSTAVGLLCRMYLGWPRQNASLASGVRYLARQGPSKNDIYFNYYATQVMMHWGGSEWRIWNPAMRDYLIGAQATQGHERGSWFFVDEHESAAKGGRLYTTCMAIMTLEVYYRFLPLYGVNALDKPF